MGLMGLISLMGLIGLISLISPIPLISPIGPRSLNNLPVPEAHSLLGHPAVEQVVAEGDAHAGGAQPAEAVLALLEECGLLRPLIIIEVVAVGGVYRVLILVGVVLTAEEAGL
jgi:hypothetical protein